MSESLRSKAELDAAIRRERRAVLLVNTRSRRGRDHFDQVAERLEAAGFQLLARIGVRRPERLPQHLADSIGLSAQVPDRLKRRLGRIAYPMTALRLLPGHRSFTAVVAADNGTGAQVRRLRTH